MKVRIKKIEGFARHLLFMHKNISSLYCHLNEFEIESVIKSREGANLYWAVDCLILRQYTALIDEEKLKSYVTLKKFKEIKKKFNL
jgi:hypothetical protein